MQPEEFGLEDAVCQVLGTISIPAGVRVSWNFPAAPIRIRADRSQIECILSNLITNGVQAMPTGGELTLRVSCDDHTAAAEVTDTGVGISHECRTQEFEPLNSTKIKGLGLGLAISKLFAEWNGAKLKVESDPGRTTTFRLALGLGLALSRTILDKNKGGLRGGPRHRYRNRTRRFATRLRAAVHDQSEGHRFGFGQFEGLRRTARRKPRGQKLTKPRCHVPPVAATEAKCRKHLRTAVCVTDYFGAPHRSRNDGFAVMIYTCRFILTPHPGPS